MTPEREAELRALAADAERLFPTRSHVRSCEASLTVGRLPCSCGYAFIAAARTALPEALDAIERVYAILEDNFHNSGANAISAIAVLAALEGKADG
jgi:hypothetical protein